VLFICGQFFLRAFNIYGRAGLRLRNRTASVSSLAFNINNNGALFHDIYRILSG